MRRSKRGQSLVEAVIGMVVIIPIGLAALDMVVFTQVAQQNEELVEMSARAAAQRGDQASAYKAVQDVVSRVQTSSVIQDVVIQNVTFDLAKGQVSVNTAMTVRVPVPLPWLSIVTCQASSVQPIVSTPAPI